MNNDGSTELFAADMHPYSDAPEIMSQWQPVMDNMEMHDMVEGDPQHSYGNILRAGFSEFKSRANFAPGPAG